MHRKYPFWFQFLLDIFLPHLCAGCRTADYLLCPKCRPKIIPVSINRHPGPDLAVLSYTNPITRQLITDLKFKGITGTASVLADIITPGIDRALRQLNWGDITLCATPLHKRREFERGYNQVKILVNSLAYKLNTPTVTIDNGVISRNLHTKPQTNLDRKDRKNNIKNAFTITRSPKPKERLVVLDDVATTGSTIKEMRKTLHQAGWHQVIIIAVAYG